MNIKKIFLPLVLLSIVAPVNAQGYVGDSRKQVRKGLERYISLNKLQGVFEETDSTLSLIFRNTTVQNTDYIYTFNSKGKCIEEKRISCDSCIKKFVDYVLSNKQMDWRKISENRYVSKFSKRLLLIIGGNVYTISQLYWDRNMYKQVVGKLP
jgi:hypothetical protein